MDTWTQFKKSCYSIYWKFLGYSYASEILSRNEIHNLLHVSWDREIVWYKSSHRRIIKRFFGTVILVTELLYLSTRTWATFFLMYIHHWTRLLCMHRSGNGTPSSISLFVAVPSLHARIIPKRVLMMVGSGFLWFRIVPIGGILWTH
jgi:hypothetical protein